MGLPCTRRIDPVHQSPRTRMYGYFTHGTDPPPRPCSSGFLFLPYRLRRLPFPALFRRRLPGHAAFAALEVLHSRPSTGRASLATSLSLIGLLTPVPPADSASHASLFRTVPSANTLVRRVNENAFAFIVQARPCPTFGPPVHLGGRPLRLQHGTPPHALPIPPHDGHPALRKAARIGARSALAVSRFRLRARLGFSIPLPLPGPRGITPAFGYGAPHPSPR